MRITTPHPRRRTKMMMMTITKMIQTGMMMLTMTTQITRTRVAMLATSTAIPKTSTLTSQTTQTLAVRAVRIQHIPIRILCWKTKMMMMKICPFQRNSPLRISVTWTMVCITFPSVWVEMNNQPFQSIFQEITNPPHAVTRNLPPNRWHRKLWQFFDLASLQPSKPSRCLGGRRREEKLYNSFESALVTGISCFHSVEKLPN